MFLESSRLEFLSFRLSAMASPLPVDPRLPRLPFDRLLVGTVRSSCSGVSGLRDKGLLVILDVCNGVGKVEVGTNDPISMAPILPKDPRLRGALELCMLPSGTLSSRVSKLFDRDLGFSISNSSNKPANPPCRLYVEAPIPSEDPFLRNVLAVCALSSMPIFSSCISSDNPVNPPRWLSLELVPSNDLNRSLPARSRSVKVGLVDRVRFVDRS